MVTPMACLTWIPGAWLRRTRTWLKRTRCANPTQMPCAVAPVTVKPLNSRSCWPMTLIPLAPRAASRVTPGAATNRIGAALVPETRASSMAR